MTEPTRVDCDRVDELGAALTLEALEPDERRAIARHLESCRRPHEQVRSMLGAGVVLASALDPVTPSATLRDRLMASVAVTAQEHVAGMPRQAHVTEPARARRGWFDWLTARAARALAAAALVAVAVLGTWNVSLQTRVAEWERITAALTEARAVYPATGEAGRGLLLDTPDGPRFLATSVEEPPAGRLYVLWLIGPDGVPVDVGALAGDERLTLVPVEGQLDGYTTFAVTVEIARVDAPTSAPVLVANIEDPRQGS